MVGAVGRLFLAADLSADTRRALLAKLEDLLSRMPGRRVPPPNWHLTMRFLGDVDRVSYEKLVYELSEADLGSPFGVTFGNPGAFPRPARATVLWLGIDRGEERLVLVADRVEEAVLRAGFPPEDRPFRAHLTLSRIRPPENVNALLDGREPLGVKTQIEAVTLFRSHLGPAGATYEALDTFPLTKA